MAAAGDIKQQIDSILRQAAAKQNIVNFEIHSSTEANYGDGFVGQFYAGEIHDKDTGNNTHVAIKKAPPFIPQNPIDYNVMFQNEDLFYSIIFPALDELQKEMSVSDPFNNVPKYFCSSLEPKQEYIAMENLKPAGFVMVDKMQYLNKEHLEKLFQLYGKFHALSYVLRNKDEEKYQKISDKFVDLYKQMAFFIDRPMTAAISAAVNFLDSDDDKIIFDELKDFGKNALQIFLEAATYNGQYRCLIHGDCWSNNILFKYSETGELSDLKLIDFQVCQDNSPIHDLSYFFYSGASKNEFDNLDKYLEIYHKSFSEFAKQLGAKSDELFSFDVLRKEWKENALFGVIMGVYIWQLKLMPKQNVADIADSAQKLASMEEGLKMYEMLLTQIHQTDEYREKTTGILKHAFEYGIINKNRIDRNTK